MSEKFPMKFTLSDGVHVTVNRVNETTHDFTLSDEDGKDSHFKLVEDGKTKDEIEEPLNFDQLNAVRRFWLETDEH